MFYNRNDTFNEFNGDFINVKHGELSNLNVMVGYWSSYGQHKTSLIVLLSMTESSKLSLRNASITVNSSKHGVFLKQDLINTRINNSQQRLLFVKKLILENEYDIINKVYDDVITITIGEQQYTFLNPELELE